MIIQYIWIMQLKIKCQTPVPGGVGNVTVAVLIEHVVTAAARSALQEK